jgi:hypothetical protein
VTLKKGLTSIEDDTIEEGIPTLFLCEESLYLHFIEAVEQSKNKAMLFDFENSMYDNDRESGDPALLTFAMINYNKVLATHISRMGSRKGQILKALKLCLDGMIF